MDHVTHWNFSHSSSSDFIADLPWSFQTVCFGGDAITILPDGLFARITLLEDAPSTGDRTGRVIVGFRVNIFHRVHGMTISKVFGFIDYQAVVVVEKGLQIKRFGGLVTWIDSKGVRQSDDLFYVPICTAIAAYLDLIGNNRYPADDLAALTPGHLTSGIVVDGIRSSESNPLVAVVDLE